MKRPWVVTLYQNKKAAENDENAIHVSIDGEFGGILPEVVVIKDRTFVRLPGFETVFYEVFGVFVYTDQVKWEE